MLAGQSDSQNFKSDTALSQGTPQDTPGLTRSREANHHQAFWDFDFVLESGSLPPVVLLLGHVIFPSDGSSQTEESIWSIW